MCRWVVNYLTASFVPHKLLRVGKIGFSRGTRTLLTNNRGESRGNRSAKKNEHYQKRPIGKALASGQYRRGGDESRGDIIKDALRPGDAGADLFGCSERGLRSHCRCGARYLRRSRRIGCHCQRGDLATGDAARDFCYGDCRYRRGRGRIHDADRAYQLAPRRRRHFRMLHPFWGCQHRRRNPIGGGRRLIAGQADGQ